MPGPKNKEKAIAFEKALEKLESILESMESGDIPLAELVSQFEEGNKLLRLCQKRLQEAELKIEQLKVKNETGEPEFEDFELHSEE